MTPMPNQPGFLGDARITHPIALRYRPNTIDREQGGSKGYRGRGYEQARKRALYLGRYRSTATGLPASEAQLVVDHIIGYRIAGITPYTNEQGNLRLLDTVNNRYLDTMEGYGEKPLIRRMRSY